MHRHGTSATYRMSDTQTDTICLWYGQIHIGYISGSMDTAFDRWIRVSDGLDTGIRLSRYGYLHHGLWRNFVEENLMTEMTQSDGRTPHEEDDAIWQRKASHGDDPIWGCEKKMTSRSTCRLLVSVEKKDTTVFFIFYFFYLGFKWD